MIRSAIRARVLPAVVCAALLAAGLHFIPKAARDYGRRMSEIRRLQALNEEAARGLRRPLLPIRRPADDEVRRRLREPGGERVIYLPGPAPAAAKP
jgi:hypothetical protein